MTNIHEEFKISSPLSSKIKLAIAIFVTVIMVAIAITAIYVDSLQEKEHSNYVQNAPERNKAAAKKPIIIGETDDGQEIKMVVIENVVKDCGQCSEYIQKHNVYYIGKTVSDNTVVHSGKQQKIQTNISVLN